MTVLTSPDSPNDYPIVIADLQAQWHEAEAQCVASVRLEAWDYARHYAEQATVLEARCRSALVAYCDLLRTSGSSEAL